MPSIRGALVSLSEPTAWAPAPGDPWAGLADAAGAAGWLRLDTRHEQVSLLLVMIVGSCADQRTEVGRQRLGQRVERRGVVHGGLDDVAGHAEEHLAGSVACFTCLSLGWRIRK
ncbi:unnamed protein product [Phytophthora lilii]|uniref:Unnamed protein product n=1 Tax=Phytophthora lilii TaxID=2077276 RepID=A0A9W6U7A9_9STRA|nr:unnamed protein product [Phytophthora lilii]